MTYKINYARVVGTGGFGNVYEGTFYMGDGMRVPVCIKCIHSRGDEKIDKRNRKIHLHEASVIERINKIRGFNSPIFYYSDAKVIVMEKLGVGVDSLCMLRGGTLNYASITRLGMTLIEQLQLLHGDGLIHRDIKPHNIVFDQAGTSPYLIDYGLVCEYSHLKEEKAKSIIGTAKYLSPHIHEGYEATRRDDMWSLGFTLLYAYLGTLPWEKECKKPSDPSMKTLYHLNLKIRKMRFISEGTLRLPRFLREYFRSVSALDFYDDPPYDELIKLAVEELETIYRGKDTRLKWEWEE